MEMKKICKLHEAKKDGKPEAPFNCLKPKKNWKKKTNPNRLEPPQNGKEQKSRTT